MNNNVFNIYYINFPKVYELKMILSNIVKISQEVEKEDQSDERLESSIKAKLGTSILELFNISGGVSAKSETAERSKMIETFEVKATKSVILDEILNKSSITEFEKQVPEGKLIQIKNVKLSLDNEEELRSAKLISNGMLKGLQLPEAEGLDINNVFNSILKDYAYKLIGKTDSNQKILIKIPTSFENEFESQYGIDDLFLGKVTILGIYKGKVKLDDLKNTIDYFSEIGSADASNRIGSEIKDSQLPPNSGVAEDNEKSTYHFIDVLAILQNIIIEEGNGNE